MSINEFFSMGGYGYHVWGIMLLALLMMILEPLSLVVQKKALLQRIKRNNKINQRK